MTINHLPADEVSEEQVLTTFFWEPESRKFIYKVFQQLFKNDKHRVLFKGIRQLVEEHQPIDIITLSSKTGVLVSPVEVAEFSLKNTVLSPDQLLWHINYLKELYFFRVSLNISSKIADAVSKRHVDSVIKLGLTFDRVRDALFKTEERVDQFKRAVHTVNSPIEYIPSPFPSLRSLMGGYTRKQISSIGGKSGHNKTTFSIYESVEQIKQGLAGRVLFISVDEDGEMVARRVIASQLDISLSAMRNKEVQLNECEVKLAVEKILGNRFIILDDITDADAIASAVLEIKPDRVIIDHIQELSYGDTGISDAKVMVAAGKLKAAGRLANANVTILSQVRDKLIDERFDSKVPRPHDFLYASDLRRKSREQCVVYWEYKDTQRDTDYPFFDFIVWKSTYSETGRIRFNVFPDRARFAEMKKLKDTEPKKSGSVWDNIGEL